MGSVPSRFSAKKTNLFHSASRISFGWIPLQHMSRGDGTDRVARRDGCPFEPGSTCGIPSHASASRIDGRAYVRFHASRLHRRRDGMAHPPYSMFQRPFRRILPFLAWSPRCISIVLRVMWMVSSPSNGPFFAISHRGNAPPPPSLPRTDTAADAVRCRTPIRPPLPVEDPLSVCNVSSACMSPMRGGSDLGRVWRRDACWTTATRHDVASVAFGAHTSTCTCCTRRWTSKLPIHGVKGAGGTEGIDVGHAAVANHGNHGGSR